MRNYILMQNEVSVLAAFFHMVIFMNNEKRIISFPAGKTYEHILHTSVHAHPIKRGFPKEPTSYVMFRKSGGENVIYETGSFRYFAPFDGLSEPEIDHVFVYFSGPEGFDRDAFSLNPEECVFIDDSAANAAGAVACGWKGIVFHGSSEELERKLRNLGVEF